MKNILVLLFVFCFSQGYAYTLPQQPTKSYDCDVCDNLSHETLHDRWSTVAQPLNKSASNTQKSYSYNLKVTAKQLAEGVALTTHAPGTVIRIIPLHSKTIPTLELKTTATQFMSLKDAASLYSQDGAIDESLRSNTQQTMFQIRPELGFGTFTIKSKKSNAAEANAYLIHVFEKYALIYLQVEPSALHYQYGDSFTATITLKDIDSSYSIDDISASLLGPNNQIIPLNLKEMKRNQFQTSATLLSDQNTRGDNWYIEVDVVSEQDDGPVHRSGRAAFSYSVPSASLLSIKKVSSNPLTFAATVDVATASRYALQSVLFSKNTKGQILPIETAQSAQWLESGKQTIKFSFDNSTQLAEDQLSVGYLHLTDYGQLKTVYQYDQPIKLSQLME